MIDDKEIRKVRLHAIGSALQDARAPGDVVTLIVYGGAKRTSKRVIGKIPLPYEIKGSSFVVQPYRVSVKKFVGPKRKGVWVTGVSALPPRRIQNELSEIFYGRDFSSPIVCGPFSPSYLDRSIPKSNFEIRFPSGKVLAFG